MECRVSAFAASICGIVLGMGRHGCMSGIDFCSMTGTGPLVCCVGGASLVSLDASFVFRRMALRGICLLCATSWRGRLDRPRTSCIVCIRWVLGCHGVDMSADEVATLARDRCAWRKLIITCSATKV